MDNLYLMIVFLKELEVTVKNTLGTIIDGVCRTLKVNNTWI